MKKTVTVTTEIDVDGYNCSPWCERLSQSDPCQCVLFRCYLELTNDCENWLRCEACLEATGDKEGEG
jgi:hypothetical protein